MDQDNYNTIVQDDYYFHPSSNILDIDSLSSNNDTSSGAITDNYATEEDLYRKSVPRNLRPNAEPLRADAGTRFSGFNPVLNATLIRRQRHDITNSHQDDNS